MVQSGKQLSGVAIKGHQPAGRAISDEACKGRLRRFPEEKGKRPHREGARKAPGAFYRRQLHHHGALRRFLPDGVDARDRAGAVGGIFETGMYEIDNTLVVMPLADIESAMGIGATGIEVKLNDEYQAADMKWTILKALGPRLFREDLDGDEPEPFLRPQARETGDVHHPGPYHPRGELQHNQLAHHDGHGEEERYRDTEIHRGQKAEHHEDLHDGRDDDRRGRRLFRVSYRVFPVLDNQEHRAYQAPEDVYYITTLPVKISIIDVMLIALVTMVICVLSTIYPSYKAAKIDPVETLRYE